ncbi:MAG: family 10 glycosylhydrolase [Planctomycetaceae bacterium]
MLWLFATPAFADEHKSPTERPIRIRVEWGGTTPQCWNGLVEVSRGRLEQPVSLGIEADEPGTIWVDRGAVWLQRSSRIYDGFDVSVVAPSDATLSLTLQSTAPAPDSIRKQFNVPIADFHRGDDNVLKQEDDSLRVVIRRAPGDLLIVNAQRPHMIFGPGEVFAAAVTLDAPNRTDRKTKTELSWQLRPARSDNTLREESMPVYFGDGETAATSVPITVPLPAEEGSYDIRFAQRENGRETKQRAVQVLVLDSARKSTLEASMDAPAVLVDSFQPGGVNLLRRVAVRTNAQAFSQAVTGLLSVFPASDDGEQKSAAENSVKWNAYKLRVRHPQRPHRLVVSANSSTTQNVGISVLEPNAADQLMPVGLDSGLIVIREQSISSDSSARAASGMVKHELLFWPKVSDPVVMLHDMGTDTPLDVALVEVYELASLPMSRSANPVSQDEPPRRLVGPYMHKPMLPENFGARQAIDPQSGRSLHDWVTFHQSALRTAEYLHHFGYNSLLLAVLADGSTIYPSDLLQPTPRYDTGTFFSSGQDPERKDVLDLLFRVFDREGLTLVPELQFSTPLPALERLIAADSAGSRGIELIGRDGRSWREAQKTMRGLAPYYNPLDPRVQQAILDVVGELAARYHAHSSFGGLAVELSGMGYLQLPGLEWGYDDETIARFSAATGVAVPAGEGNDRYQRRHDFLTSQQEAKWTRWRSEELARFHRRLADALHAHKPQSQFILACTQVLGDSSYDNEVAEALRSGRKLDSLLAEKGIIFDLYADAENFTVLRPAIWRSAANPLARAADQTINDGSFFSALFSTCRQGSLFYHIPCECRIADFDNVSPWQPAYTWLVAQASMGGIENRKRYADALASGDAQMLFDGGWLIPLGQERLTSKIRAVVSQLPAVPFHLNKVQQQPVTIRVARHQAASWIYAVNQMPYPVSVRLQLTCKADLTGNLLPDGSPLALAAGEDGKKTTQFQLEPYDVWACRLSDASVTVENVEAEIPEASLSEIAARIQRIDRTIGEMRQVQSAPRFVVQNPGFERQTNEQAALPGWELPGANAARWSLDIDNPRSGSSSLLLTAADDDGAALSSALPADAGMRLFTMSVWLRSDREAADVRLVFSADADGKQHVRYLPVTVNTEWKHYQFRVTDIPADRLENAKVRIEIRGPGKLWIDDVDIHQNRLSPEDLRQITKTHSAITVAWSEGRYADCQRLLDSYWGQVLFDDSQSNTESGHGAKRTATGLRRLFRQ